MSCRSTLGPPEQRVSISRTFQRQRTSLVCDSLKRLASFQMVTTSCSHFIYEKHTPNQLQQHLVLFDSSQEHARQIDL